MLAVMAGYFRLHRDRSFSVSTVQPSLDENPAENGGSQERKPPMPRHPSRLVAHGRHEDGHWQDAEAGCPSEGPPRDSGQARRIIHKVERDHRQEIGRASCRESVCQSVWISVVAVSLKKKKKKKKTKT